MTSFNSFNPQIVFNQLPGLKYTTIQLQLSCYTTPPQTLLSSFVHVMPFTAMFTPKNFHQLDHQHKKFVKLSSFSSIDASPCQAQYTKILQAVQASMLQNNNLQARYNQLQAANSAVTFTQQQTRRCLSHRGQILSVIDL